LLSLTVAAPAVADQLVVRDRTGDVLEGRVDVEGGYGVQSDMREGDVVATTFRHGPRRVVVSTTFRALDEVGKYHGYYLRVESARHVYRDVTLEAGPGRWGGRLVVTDRRGQRVRCAARHTIDYDRNVVRVVVPRSCLGRPRFVRATAANAWTRPDTSDPSQSDLVALDNPHNTSHRTDTWTRWIRRG
jgi:hypothetical protein